MIRPLLACLLAVLPLAAQAQTTLHIALREEADMLDPTLARTYVGRIVFAGLCDKLFDIDDKLQIVPQLATGYEWADPKTLVIHLRAGVLFHDGTTMDAAAVKYSLDRHLTMAGSARSSEINAMEHVDVVDPATVRVVLKTPSAPFLSQLTDRAGMIVSPKAAAAEGKDFALHPVCAGPMKFVERVAQDRIVLERFADYWNKDAIHVDRVIYQPIADSSVRLANLQAGSLDIVEYIVPTDTDAVKRDPKLRLVSYDGLGYQGITYNIGNGPQANTPIGRSALVRQAFDMSIDRDALMQVVYNGMFPPAAQAVPPESPFFDPAVKPVTRDVDRAKALLKQAGVTLPVTVKLIAPNSPDQRQMAEVIQSMAAEAGFDVKITAMEFAASLDNAQNGAFEAYLLAWSGRVDPDGNLYSFLHSNTGTQNYGKYSSPVMDTLLDNARLETDTAKRRALYGQIAVLGQTDLPISYIYTTRYFNGLSAKVRGFKPVADGLIRLQGISLAP
jgi:peptide/nickel transport system substrate-binding protein